MEDTNLRAPLQANLTELERRLREHGHPEEQIKAMLAFVVECRVLTTKHQAGVLLKTRTHAEGR